MSIISASLAESNARWLNEHQVLFRIKNVIKELERTPRNKNEYHNLIEIHRELEIFFDAICSE